MGRTKQTERRSTNGESAPQGSLQSLSTTTNSLATNTDQGNGPKSVPSKTMSTVDKRWVSQDLDLLRSGLFADAEVSSSYISFPPRKVHRSILAARSDWFKKAFSGSFTEGKYGRVLLDEPARQINLLLYFFYSGGIDVADKDLTGGRDVMAISIELLRLGGSYESRSMRDYGKDMLVSYLRGLLHHLCDPTSTDKEKEDRFNSQEDLTRNLCLAIRNAYDTRRPVKPAQAILADFTFAARIHLFKNMDFVSFIETKEIPEFGNLVLIAQMTGAVSDAFQNNDTFKKWQDWRVTPSRAPADDV